MFIGGFYKYDRKVFGQPEKPSGICGKCWHFTLSQFCYLRLIKNLRILPYCLSEAVKMSKKCQTANMLIFYVGNASYIMGIIIVSG